MTKIKKKKTYQNRLPVCAFNPLSAKKIQSENYFM